MTADPDLAKTLCSMLVEQYALSQRGRAVVAIAGESGSGKSVTADNLALAFGDCRMSAGILNQDDYFKLPPRTNHEHRCLDLANVGSQEVDLALLHSHIVAFREGRDGVVAPRVDYQTNTFNTRQIDFSGLSVLIVEGTYVLGLDDVDVRIFLEATSNDTRERRRVRNRDIDAPIVEQVLAIEHELIAPQVALAQIVIDKEFRIRSA